MASPLEALAKVKTLEQAERLYDKLGEFLAVPTPGPSREARKVLREEAKEVRRRLEERYGDNVRGVSAGYRRMFVPGKTAAGAMRELTPTWTKRTHFTLRKPEKSTIKSPLMLHVPLDPRTLEPSGVYYATESAPHALGAAMERLHALRQSRQRRRPGQTAQELELGQVRQEIEEIETILPQLRSFDFEASALNAELEKLIKRREYLTAQRRTAGKSSGAGPDGNT